MSSLGRTGPHFILSNRLRLSAIEVGGAGNNNNAAAWTSSAVIVNFHVIIYVITYQPDDWCFLTPADRDAVLSLLIFLLDRLLCSIL